MPEAEPLNKVYACIDGHANTAAVVDWASWAALKLDAPLELLNVVEHLFQDSASLDAVEPGVQHPGAHTQDCIQEKRAHAAHVAAELMLAAAQARAVEAGVVRLDARLRDGAFVDNVVQADADARLLVLAINLREPDRSALHMDINVLRILSEVNEPVLVVTGQQFLAPRRLVIAFDGSATAQKMIHTVASSPMLKGLPVLLAMAGASTAVARAHLLQATALLSSTGHKAEARLSPGAPEYLLPALIASGEAALLVMGAYGHSPVPERILGSTTTSLLRSADIPILIFR